MSPFGTVNSTKRQVRLNPGAARSAYKELIKALEEEEEEKRSTGTAATGNSARGEREGEVEPLLPEAGFDEDTMLRMSKVSAPGFPQQLGNIISLYSLQQARAYLSICLLQSLSLSLSLSVCVSLSVSLSLSLSIHLYL